MVGESGCGKSTLARMVTLIEKPTEGTLMLAGVDAVDTPAAERRRLRQAVQLVFQNPYGSLNPRNKISAVLETRWPSTRRWARPSAASGRARCWPRSACGPSTPTAIPHMFSGGQRQRIAIARALMLNPTCWWPTSRCRRWTSRSRPRC